MASRAIDRIDVHAHFVPEFYREAQVAAGHSKPDGIAAIPPWDAPMALRTMDELGVATAFISITSPGVHFGDDAQARHLCRLVNAEGARLQREHPGRFGHLASVPLPDVEGSLSEAAYALDVLGADGLLLETNHHGVYLGDERLEPLYAELDNRSAAVLIHPTSPACSCSPRLDAKFPRPAFEFIFETTRAVIDLVVAGVLQRHPKIRFIVPHAGAALPVLMSRVDLALPMLASPGTPPPPTLREAMRALHFDLAGVPVPTLLRALLEVADESRLHYGSDYPYTPAAACERLMQALETTPLLDDRLRAGIWRENAKKLFPSLSSTP